MSMRKIAEFAGVSTSTVSRVLNAHPSISPKTAGIVRAAMETLNLHPSVRRSNANPRNGGTQLIAYIIFGQAGRNTSPIFEQLLRGLSEAANERNVDLVLAIGSELNHLPPRVLNGSASGVLLGGDRPSDEIQRRLEKLPCVWLMGNRQRPLWGHQVMPDNTAIGQIAAQYLFDRKHRHVCCLMGSVGGWSLKFRALAFEEAAKERGMVPHLFIADEPPPTASWNPEALAHTANRLVDQWLALDPRPTGIFISEDRFVAPIDSVLAARRIRLDAASGIDVISCNNERQYLAGLHMNPATIDINAGAIARHGIELLVRSIRDPTVYAERTRVMIGPRLVEASR